MSAEKNIIDSAAEKKALSKNSEREIKTIGYDREKNKRK